MDYQQGRHLKLAYLAGLIDGEGSITITVRVFKKKQYSWAGLAPTLRITNTDYHLLSVAKEYIREIIGTDRKIKRNGNKRENRKQGFRILVNKRSDLEKLLKELLPYLILKKENARILLDYFDSHRYYEKTKMSDIEFLKRIQKLHDRGIYSNRGVKEMSLQRLYADLSKRDDIVHHLEKSN